MTSVREVFAARRERVILPLASRLKAHLESLFDEYARIDLISVRAKSVDRFVVKAEKQENGKPKYDDPLSQIQDQLGARIVMFYKTDVDKLAAEIKKYFRYIESIQIVPDSEHEFGYEGHHFILFIPSDLVDDGIKEDENIEFFELQIKTLFQHAWSEADHDLGYKPSAELSTDQKRRLAFTAAQAWGADLIFDELFRQTNVTSKS
jgi:putative GTP pyrophosphokinase